MPETTTENYLIVEQIVESILGQEPASLDGLVTRAQDVKDPVSAGSLPPQASIGPLLRKHLESHRGDVGALEALVILCLADTKLSRQLHFPLVAEARRLGGLLLQEGRAQRAQELLEAIARLTPGDRGVEKDLAAVMRRTGNVDRLIERYLARAEEAEASGRRRDAITWLREVLMLDSSRRDVARMIRDLQYESSRVRNEWRRHLRSVGIGVVLLGVVAGLVLREQHVQREYAAIPSADGEDRQSLEARLFRLDALIEGNPLWLGMFKAGRERADLRIEIERLHAREAELARTKADRRAERQILADSARVRARQMVESMDYEGAVEQYEQALRAAPSGWSQRERVESDLEAVRAHLREQKP